MEYTNPKQGITVSIPDGLSNEEINEGLRGMIRDNEQLTGQQSTREVEDMIGMAAIKAPRSADLSYG